MEEFPYKASTDHYNMSYALRRTPSVWQCNLRTKAMIELESFIPRPTKETRSRNRFRSGSRFRVANGKFYNDVVFTLRASIGDPTGDLQYWSGALLEMVISNLAFVLKHCRPIALLALTVVAERLLDFTRCGQPMEFPFTMLGVDYAELHADVLAHLGVPGFLSTFPLRYGEQMEYLSTEKTRNSSLYLSVLSDYQHRYCETSREFYYKKPSVCHPVTTTLAPHKCTTFERDDVFYDPATYILDVCVDGVTGLAQIANEFWHFFRGHFLETLALLIHHQLLNDETIIMMSRHRKAFRLTFGHPYMVCPRRIFLAFYELLTDSSGRFPGISEGGVRFDPGCARARSRPGAIILQMPLMRVTASTFDWPNFLGTCRRVPRTTRLLAMTRLGGVGSPLVSGSPQVMLIYRRKGRDFVNRPELANYLAELCKGSSKNDLCSFREVLLEDMSWSEQVQHALRTDAFIAFHGAAGGSHEVWLPPGAVVIEFQPAGAWYCQMSYCAAADVAREVLFILSTTADTAEAFPGSSLPEDPPLFGPNYKTFMRKYASRRIVGLAALKALGIVLEMLRTKRTTVSRIVNKDSDLSPLEESSTSLSVVFKRWAAQGSAGVVESACYGTALQIYE